MRVMFSNWMKNKQILISSMLLENGKRKYITHSIITKLFSVLMNRFVFKFWGSFLSSTTDSSPDENGPIFPGLRSGRVAMDYRLRKTYL